MDKHAKKLSGTDAILQATLIILVIGTLVTFVIMVLF
jgi:hypothetical protein